MLHIWIFYFFVDCYLWNKKINKLKVVFQQNGDWTTMKMLGTLRP